MICPLWAGFPGRHPRISGSPEPFRVGSPMQCNAMQCKCNAMQCNAMQCNAMQCNAKQCKAMQSNLGDLKIWKNLGDLKNWRNRAQGSEEPGWKSQMNWTHRGMLRARRAPGEPRPNISRTESPGVWKRIRTPYRQSLIGEKDGSRMSGK